MIIIRMEGGLGNQMFAYALYLKLKSLGKEVKIDDVTEYYRASDRPHMLWTFGLDYPRASKNDICTLTDGFMSFPNRVRRKIFGRKSLEYHESSLNFDEKVINSDPAYLTGYFQSYRYFKDISDLVRSEFTFIDKVKKDPFIESYLQKISSYGKNAVSIHIRRGDYLDNEAAFGNICTENYYQSAMKLILEKRPEAHFFVFSNDEPWAKEWASSKGNISVIQGIPEEKGYLAMFLMSRCGSHILANSSFSWWAQFLNDASSKLVVSPSPWFGDRDCHELYMDSFMKVSPEGTLLL